MPKKDVVGEDINKRQHTVRRKTYFLSVCEVYLLEFACVIAVERFAQRFF